ncbi:MAG: ABC transporter permease [candidate division NC10 bacterium]|nr:ABC transporter permease [candidate division NC10 bacterium]
MRAFVLYMGGLALLGARALREGVMPPYRVSLFLGEVYTTGVTSLPFTIISALFAGMVVALQSAHEMARFGAKLYVGMAVGIAMVRGVGPVLTGLLVGGKVGAGIAAEVGSMKLTEQIDALRMIGTSYVKILVVPRVLAGIVVFPLLTVVADLVGMVGGLPIALFELNVDARLYWNGIYQIVTLQDVFTGLAKAAIFGLLIGLIGCHQGLTVEGGTAELGRAATMTVVHIGLAILIADFLFQKLVFIL